MQKRSEHRHDDEVIDRETIRAPMRRRNELYRDDPCGDKMSVQSASLVLWSNPGYLESRLIRPLLKPYASVFCALGKWQPKASYAKHIQIELRP